MKKSVVSFLVSLGFALLVAPFGYAGELNDADALRGVTTGKVVFDIGLGNASTLPLYLKVIGMTHDGLVKQGVKPDMVLAFHGGAVKLISRDKNTPLEQLDALDEIAALIQGLLKKPGIRMEACGLATHLFKVDNDTILPGIKPVANTYVSLIGYNAQGYAAIPIY